MTVSGRPSSSATAHERVRASDGAPSRLVAVVPCAGTGSRAGTEGPKQYAPIAGQPLVLHTLAALAQVPRIARILVVVSPTDEVCRQLDLPARCEVVAVGGDTRAASVLGGLRHLAGEGDAAWVLVHDAARCLVTPASIDALIDACLPDAVGGLLAHKLADTLKRAVGAEGPRSAETLDRSDKWLAQTPQMFRLARLRQALESAGSAVTDEASAIESMGDAPLLVEGGARNFKVTYPDDFALAEAVLAQRDLAGASKKAHA